MKQVSLIFNLVLSVAVATLFYFHFSENKTEEPMAQTEQGLTVNTPKNEYKGSIVYVNSDTLWGKYELIVDLQNELSEKKRRQESYLVNKGQKLEEDAFLFQQKASQMTEPQLILNQSVLQQDQMDLQTRQQKLMEEQQRIEKNLYDEQQTMGFEIREELTAELKKYSVDNGYQIILAYSSISDLLYAPDSLEITSELVTSLNEKYKAKQATVEEVE
ncbi:MAG: OmpH family outer membrane protein [Flavobacteriales bacterium]|nr:OmpH family outer membrane protein [Flavobacteriales bacterium]